MNIPKEALALIDTIEKHKFEAYVVGGFVRDSILGRDIYDIDVASSAKPEELKLMFKDYRIIDTGIRHGTITAIVDKRAIEITTYRIDGEYKDRRHPEKVSFTTSLKADLSRRDFTINAMAYNPKMGLVDYFGGRSDLEQRLIRAVGEPDTRFMEDGLRILRALRFASQLSFEIATETQVAIFKNKAILEMVAWERKAEELKKILLGSGVKDVLLGYAPILDGLVQGLSQMEKITQRGPYHIYNVLEHTAVAVANIEAKYHLRLAMLLHDIGKIQTHTTDEKGVDHFYGHGGFSYLMAEVIMTNLRVDKQTYKRVLCLIKYHDIPVENSDKWIKRWLNRLGEDCFFELLKVKVADCVAKSPKVQNRLEEFQKIELKAKSIIEEGECFSLRHLAVDGDDLIEFGFEKGPRIGETLKFLLEKVMNNEVSNKKYELLQMLK